MTTTTLAPESKVVQSQLGQRIIEAVCEFAANDIPSVNALEAETFKHVRDAKLRRLLAETLYGARWLYKLGLVTLAANERLEWRSEDRREDGRARGGAAR